MELIGYTNGQMLNFANIARDVGIDGLSAPTCFGCVPSSSQADPYNYWQYKN